VPGVRGHGDQSDVVLARVANDLRGCVCAVDYDAGAAVREVRQRGVKRVPCRGLCAPEGGVPIVDGFAHDLPVARSETSREVHVAAVGVLVECMDARHVQDVQEADVERAGVRDPGGLGGIALETSLSSRQTSRCMTSLA